MPSPRFSYALVTWNLVGLTAFDFPCDLASYYADHPCWLAFTILVGAVAAGRNSTFRYLTGSLEAAPETGQLHIQAYGELHHSTHFTKQQWQRAFGDGIYDASSESLPFIHTDSDPEHHISSEALRVLRDAKPQSANIVGVRAEGGGRERARDYCGLEQRSRETGQMVAKDGHILGPVHGGRWASTGGVGSRSKWLDVKEQVKQHGVGEELLEAHPDVFFRCQTGLRAAEAIFRRKREEKEFQEGKDQHQRNTILCLGLPRTGKTSSVFNFCRDGQHGSPFRLTSAMAHWFDGYHQQHVILIDGTLALGYPWLTVFSLSDLTSAWLPAGHLQGMGDPYPFRVQVKGDTVTLKHSFLFITTNKLTEDEFVYMYNSVDPLVAQSIQERITSVYLFSKNEQPKLLRGIDYDLSVPCLDVMDLTGDE